MRLTLPIFWILTFLPYFSYSTGDFRGTGARSTALGNSSVSLSDTWAGQNNQAGLAGVKGFSGGVYFENPYLLKQLSVKSAIFAIPTSAGVFGVNATYTGYSQYNESKAGLAFARAFGEKLMAGIQLDYLGIRLGENYGNTNAFSVEAGVQYKLLKNLTIGAHIFNPNRARVTKSEEERIPTIMKLGLKYDFSDKVFIVAETEKISDYKPLFKAGIEYHPVSVLYLRTGIYSNPALTRDTYTSAAITCFGFGLNYKQINLDLSGSYHPNLGITPQISLTYSVVRK